MSNNNLNSSLPSTPDSSVPKTNFCTDNFVSIFNYIETELILPKDHGDKNKELVQSAASGDLNNCKKLLARGDTDVNSVLLPNTALQAACLFGHLDVINLLLKNSANFEIEDQNGMRALHYAAHSGEPLAITLLAKANANLNATNKQGQTPLHIAVNQGHMQVAHELLGWGCQPGLQDCLGETPLQYAITTKRDDILELLLEFNKDVTLTNDRGFNALLHSAYSGNSSAMRILLQKLPKSWIVDEKNDDCNTALHLATKNNHAEVQIGGTDMNSQNINLQRPLHLTVENHNTPIGHLLVSAGCDIQIQCKECNTHFNQICEECYQNRQHQHI